MQQKPTRRTGASGLPSPGKPGVQGETSEPPRARDPQRPGGALSNARDSEKEGKRESAGTRAVVEGQQQRPSSPPSADRESSTPEQPYVAGREPEAASTDPENRHPRERDGL